MPLPRKSLIGKSPATHMRKKKKATAVTSRARRGELLLFTAGPAMPDYIIKDVADGLIVSVLDHNGRTLQIINTRVDGRKIYGKYRELHEAAPYMFV